MPDPSPTAADTTPPPAPPPDPPDTLALAGTAPGGDAAPPGDAAAVTVPGYDILGELGRGGMGVVYRARDVQLDREVAIKLLADDIAPGASAAVRFVEEARITGQLQHPGIPAVHQAGTLADGRPYLVMKLIKGQTLERQIKDGAAAGPLVAAFEQVCQAVGYVHSRRVVHRDLKPLNVMVGAFGEVQVMDWGLAKVLADGPNPDAAVPAAPAAEEKTQIRTGRELHAETQAGSVFGTPAYMPPEQAGGEIDKIDARADVFGLGAVLCTILTGSPPYVGAAAAVRLMSVRGDLAECHARLAGCGADPELVALAVRCLAADRAARPADAGEVAAAVAGLRAAADDRARRAELDRAAAAVRSAERRKRRRVWYALTAAVAALVAVAGGGLWWADAQSADRRRERERVAADRALAEADRERERDRADADRRRDRDIVTVAAAEAVRGALAEAEAALRTGRPADVYLKQAAARLAEADDPDLAGRHAALARDAALVAELDRVRNAHWTWVGDKRTFDYDAGRRGYPAAFARYGVAPDDPAAAARVRDSVVRVRIVVGLSDWWGSTAGGADPVRAAVNALLDAVDPNPLRKDVLAAVKAKDVPALKRLVADPRAAGLQAPVVGVVIDLLFGTGRDLDGFLQRCVFARPNDFPLLFTIASRLSHRGQASAADALGYYRAALAVAPANTAALSNLGLAYEETGDPGRAALCYERVVALDPKHVTARLNLAHMASDRGEYAAAEGMIRAVLAFAPGDDRAVADLGTAVFRRGGRPEAATAAAAAVASAAGFAAVTRGWQDDGLAVLRRGAADRTGSYIFQYRLAEVVWANGDQLAAAAPMAEAARLSPDSAYLRLRLATLFGQLQRGRDSIETARAGLAMNPDPWLQASLQNTIRHACLEARRTAVRVGGPPLPAAVSRAGAAAAGTLRATAAAREAVRQDPQNEYYFVMLSQLERAAGDLPAAENAARRAVGLRPEYETALGELGLVRYQRKKYADAEVAARAALRVNPAGDHTHLLLVQILVAAGEPEAARIAVADAVKQFGADAPLIPRLRDLLRPAAGPAR